MRKVIFSAIAILVVTVPLLGARAFHGVDEMTAGADLR